MAVTDKRILDVLQTTGGNKAAAARLLGLSPSTYKDRLAKVKRQNIYPEPDTEITTDNGLVWQEDRTASTWVIVCKDAEITSPDEVIAKANIDLAVWEIDRIKIGRSTVTFKGQKDHIVHKDRTDKTAGLKQSWKTTGVRTANPNITIHLKRKVSVPVENAAKELMDRLASKSPVVPKIKRVKLRRPSSKRREMELCLMDPHYGMRCWPPGADAEWSPELCASIVMDTVDVMLNERCNTYGEFEKIIFPLGNDFFHTDSIWQTTTAGTPQPEADAYYHTFITGKDLAITIIEKLKEIAPVEIYSIPGNHDRTTSFMLGQILEAYYRNDQNIVVHADESPYKFHRYGVTLLGYEHGHSVNSIRLGNLMSNEVPQDWAETLYREWHVGDQHRKGSGKPSWFEEQGVSVEFLPGLTPPNEWHRLKSFNWQKRGTMAFVYDFDEGPIGRHQVNIDARLNCLMGRGTA